MSKKCLIIDDVDVSRYVIGGIAQDLGLEVEEAADEIEALDKLKATRFDVIFLDWHLKKSDGLELVPRIRSMALNGSTPIIVCTGVEKDKELSDIKNTNVQSLIKKPSTMAAVKQELMKLSII